MSENTAQESRHYMDGSEIIETIDFMLISADLTVDQRRQIWDTLCGFLGINEEFDDSDSESEYSEDSDEDSMEVSIPQKRRRGFF